MASQNRGANGKSLDESLVRLLVPSEPGHRAIPFRPGFASKNLIDEETTQEGKHDEDYSPVGLFIYAAIEK